MLRKLLLAALLALGFAALAPQGASAAPIGPVPALQSEAAPAIAEKAQYYYRRPYYRRPFYARPYYRRPFYAPRPFYRRPYYGPRRFYYGY